MELKEESSILFQYSLISVYIIILSIGAFFNIYINYIGKGETWDLYPYAEIFWVVLSIIITLRTKTFKQLIFAVIIFLFLDSFVDLVAMGHHSWWAGPPLLIEWKWSTVDPGLLQKYWFFKWVVQVPVRCLVISISILNPFEKKIKHRDGFIVLLCISTGLNIIWLAAPQDVLFYFVWYGLYDPNFHYFFYLAPAGTWNLYNMLFFRVPLGIAIGIILILIGKKIYYIDNSQN